MLKFHRTGLRYCSFLLIMLWSNISHAGAISFFSYEEGQLLETKFEYDSANIIPESFPLLDGIAVDMQTLQWIHVNFVIEGHTDSRGSDEYNMNLSYARAQAVKNYLVEKHHIDTDRLLVKGFGETQLIEKADTEEAHSINRRVILKGNKKPERLNETGNILFLFGNVADQYETRKIYKILPSFNRLLDKHFIRKVISIFNEDCTEKRVYKEVEAFSKDSNIIIIVGDILVDKNQQAYFKTIDTDENVLQRSAVKIEEITKPNSLTILVINPQSHQIIQETGIKLPENIVIYGQNQVSSRTEVLENILRILTESRLEGMTFQEFLETVKKTFCPAGNTAKTDANSIHPRTSS